MAAGTTVFRDTLISVVLAGVRVTQLFRFLYLLYSQSVAADGAVFHGSLISVILAGVPQRRGNYVVADDRVIRHSVVSLILVDVRVTSRILRSTGWRGHQPQRYISQSSTCFCSLQEITSLQTTVARSYTTCVADYVVADGGVIRGSLMSVFLAGVPLTSRKLHRSRQQSHPPQCRIPYSDGCSRHVTDITFNWVAAPSATALYLSF